MARATYRLYRVLGVSRGATLDEIKRAWRAAARALHPDRNPDDPDAAAKFAAASAAWAVLSDPRKRRVYDRYGDHAVDLGFPPSLDVPPERPRRAPPPRRPPADPTAFPGGWDGSGRTEEEAAAPPRTRPRPPGRPGRPRPAAAPPRASIPRRGPDLRIDVTIPLKTAALGGTWRVEVDRPVPCGKCEGTGWRLAGRACTACKGRGVRVERGEAVLKIPPDTHDNRVIKTRGAGGPGIDGGEPGDLWATVKVAPHPTLVRRGLDLWTTVEVSPDLARRGGTIDVATLHDVVSVEIPAGTPDGRDLRVKGAGVPGPRGRLPGDLHVRVRIPEG